MPVFVLSRLMKFRSSLKPLNVFFPFCFSAIEFCNANLWEVSEACQLGLRCSFDNTLEQKLSHTNFFHIMLQKKLLPKKLTANFTKTSNSLLGCYNLLFNIQYTHNRKKINEQYHSVSIGNLTKCVFTAQYMWNEFCPVHASGELAAEPLLCWAGRCSVSSIENGNPPCCGWGVPPCSSSSPLQLN